MVVGRGPLVGRAGATVGVDLDLIDRTTEVGVADSIRAVVAEIVVVDVLFAGATGATSAGATDAIFAGSADAISAGAAVAISAGAADAIPAGPAVAISAGAADAISTGPAGAMVGDFGDAVARSAVVVDLSIPRLSMQQNMEPKVMCIPLSRSAYTD